MNLSRIAKKIAETIPVKSPEDVLKNLSLKYEDWEIIDDQGLTPNGNEPPTGEIYSVFFYPPMNLTQDQYDELEAALGDKGSLGNTLDDFNTNNYIQIDINVGHTNEEIINFIREFESENESLNKIVQGLQLAGYLQHVKMEESEPNLI